MLLPLQDKVVVIIGGTGGLGRSAAKACVAAGARVVVVGRDAARCQETSSDLGDAVRGWVGDAADPETAPRAIAVAQEAFGCFDALYHVAGGSGRRRGDGPLHTVSDDGWSYTLQLNLTSLFYSNRAAVQQFLRDERGGCVLNMSSVLADRPSPRFFATHGYATSKAGAIGLTLAAAACYAPQGIRFNVVAPALVATPLAERARQDPQIMRYVSSKQPLDGGRIGEPQDLDAAVVYLLSDDARFVTGQVLRVDGGWSLTEGQYFDGFLRDS